LGPGRAPAGRARPVRRRGGSVMRLFPWWGLPLMYGLAIFFVALGPALLVGFLVILIKRMFRRKDYS
jgi:hypothetical protein